MTDEFKTEPKNYNTIPALSDPEKFDAMLQRWRENGILYARDIVRNATSTIDYNMRVGENSNKQGFGQVDK